MTKIFLVGLTHWPSRLLMGLNMTRLPINPVGQWATRPNHGSWTFWWYLVIASDDVVSILTTPKIIQQIFFLTSPMINVHYLRFMVRERLKEMVVNYVMLNYWFLKILTLINWLSLLRWTNSQLSFIKKKLSSLSSQLSGACPVLNINLVKISLCPAFPQAPIEIYFSWNKGWAKALSFSTIR